jgi:hypothetical protein
MEGTTHPWNTISSPSASNRMSHKSSAALMQETKPRTAKTQVCCASGAMGKQNCPTKMCTWSNHPDCSGYGMPFCCNCVIYKNAMWCSEYVTLATDTAHCIQSTGGIISWFQCHFVHHKSDMDWHWTDRPLSNILSHGIARFVMPFDDRTWQWQNCYCKLYLRHHWKSRSCDPVHSWLLASGS